MRIPREAWWLGGLIVFILVLVAFLTGPTRRAERVSPADATTYSTSDDGLRALYVTLERLGYEPRRLRTPFTTATLPRQAVMVVVDPPMTPTIRELDALQAWVERGHVLLIAGELAVPFAEPAFPTRSPFAEPPVTYARAMQPASLSRGVNRLAVRADYRIRRPGAPTSDEDENDEQEPAHRPPFIRWPMEYPRKWKDALSSAVPILADKFGTVAAYAGMGQGDLIVLSSPWSLSNQGIRRSDNLIFVLNALGPPGPVYFDEYHHGYGENLWWALVPVPLKLAAAQLLLALFVAMYSLSRRFGVVIPLDRGRRQRSEFLGTMTVLLSKGQATRLALRTAYDAATQRLRTELGLAPDAGVTEIGQAASRLRPQAAEKLESVLRQCRGALEAAGAVTEPRALALVRQLDEAVRLVLRGA